MEEARLADVPLERRSMRSCNNDKNYCYYWNNSDEDDGPRRRRRESMVNKLISTVYSGPTISDIESALSFTGGDQQQLLTMDNTSATSSIPSAPVVVFSPEKVLSKMENKYTLKIKTSSGNGGLAEDGYKWRKYGQKSIKNSPNPRSYYRCTNPRCNAKKQVERATDEADTLLVTYEGLHLHYTYSPQHLLQGGLSKKPKLQLRGPPPIIDDAPPPPPHSSRSAQDEMSSPQVVDAAHPGGGPSNSYFDDGLRVIGGLQQQQDHHQYCCFVEEEGGLLEDVVPLLVRRPCTNSTSSSPSSSVSWNPYTIDMAILSNIF